MYTPIILSILLGDVLVALAAPRMLALYETKGGIRTQPPPVTRRTTVTFRPYPTKGPVAPVVTKDPCIGKEYSSDPKNCNIFYQCHGGKMVKLPCPPGLQWNQRETMCDWPHKVNRPECPAAVASTKCNVAGDSSTGYVCPKPTGLFSVNDDCKSFYMCDHCKAIKKPCPKGLAWNQQLTTCDWPANVKGCKVESGSSQNTQPPQRPITQKPITQKPITQKPITQKTIPPTNANIKGGFAGNLMSSRINNWAINNNNNMWNYRG